MSWGALDDGFYDHPKTRAATKRCPASIGLYARAISYCSKHETDGLISYEVLEGWFFWDVDLLKEMIKSLVDVGFFDREGRGSYRVHDFLEYNPSHAKKEKERANARKRMSRLRQKGS